MAGVHLHIRRGLWCLWLVACGGPSLPPAETVAFRQAPRPELASFDQCESLSSALADYDVRRLRDAPWLVEAGEALSRCGRHELAARYLHRSLEVTDSCRGRVALGLIAADRGVALRALAHFRAALRGHPGCVAAGLNLSTLLRHMGRSGEAVDAARETLAIAPAPIAARAFDALALALIEHRHRDPRALEQAELACAEALSVDRLYAPAHNTCGLVALHRDKITQALQRFETAFVLDPLLFDAWMNYAQVVLAHRDYREALRGFEQALQARWDYDAIVGKAVSLSGLGRYEEAREIYEEAVVTVPSRAEAWFNLGVLLQDHSRDIHSLQRASECMQRFVELAAELPRFAEQRQEVSQRLERLQQ